MIQLSLFGDDQKPTPAEREAQQLVEIREYLHVCNAAERAMRLSVCMSGADTPNQHQGEVPRTAPCR